MENTEKITKMLDRAWNFYEEEIYDEACFICNDVLKMDVVNKEAWRIKKLIYIYGGGGADKWFYEISARMADALDECKIGTRKALEEKCSKLARFFFVGYIENFIDNIKRNPENDRLDLLKDELKMIIEVEKDFTEKTGINMEYCRFRYAMEIDSVLGMAVTTLNDEFLDEEKGDPTEAEFCEYNEKISVLLGAFQIGIDLLYTINRGMLSEELIWQLYSRMMRCHSDVAACEVYAKKAGYSQEILENVIKKHEEAYNEIKIMRSKLNKK